MKITNSYLASRYPKKIIFRFITVFAITLVVSVVDTFLWNLAFHGAAIIDWETSFRLAIILGIIFAIITKRVVQ